MTVAIPPSPRNYVPPTDRVIKPGETVGLFDPVVAVESDDILRLKGLIRVDTPTTFLAPGKYRIGFGGMIQSHPTLSTGTVEFEVKDRVAWGAEVDGLQIGLAGGTPTYHHGEKLKLTVKLRNVGKAEAKVTYILLQESTPLVTADGVRMTVAMPPPRDELAFPMHRVVKPGETITLYNPEIAIEPRLLGQIGPEPIVDTPTIRVQAGKYHVSFQGMLTSHPKLTTGALEFEVRNPEPPGPDVQEASNLPPVVYGPLKKDGTRNIKTRQDVVGQPVRVEGIAWGQPFGLKGQEGTISPHAGPHVVYDGGSVFVKGIDFTETKARGKPVRVTGTLRLEPMVRTRWGNVKAYYFIEATGFEQLDAVVDPNLVYLEK